MEPLSELDSDVVHSDFVYVRLHFDNDEHKVEFIHEFDLTTDRYTRNWTHWTEVKPPCL